jgi:CTP synthase
VPYLGPSGELKTKPTQHSVAALRSIGIQPDALVLRADRPVPSIKRKIALMCDVDEEAVMACRTRPASTTSPRCCTARVWTPTWCAASACRSATWTGRVGRPARPRPQPKADEVEIALVGKYIDLPDAYLSVSEALRAGGFANTPRSTSAGSPPTTAPPRTAPRGAGDVDGVWCPAGFGIRGIEGKLGALATPARTRSPRWACAWGCSAW